MEDKLIEIAQSTLNPYNSYSGTEHVAMLLYSLIRMNRPRTVVEYGSGYSSLFLLQALADNRKAFREEVGLLRQKVSQLGDLGKVDLDNPVEELAMLQWLLSPGKDCALNPEFYLTDYRPQVFSFEKLSPDHSYVKRLFDAVEQTGNQDIFSFFPGGSFSVAKVPRDKLPIDLAWNDDDDYLAFFEECWPQLNPAGGMMIFHNPSASEMAWDDIERIRKSRAKANDFEMLVLEEPHKLHQNGCVMFRKISRFEPSFRSCGASSILQQLKRFAG